MQNLRWNRLIYFALLFILTILLANCSRHIAKKDGPPKFHVDETKIPDATPKPVRLSKYGNMPYYHVFGKRYYTLKNCRNFEQVGVASWYGTQFHQRKTSSGEPYNMLGMTAAHKTLPLPTYVEVTNLQNHRKIIVKVNDRGPFASNRIIDLSYVAAKKLNMLGKGTAHVRIRAIDPYTYGRKPSMWFFSHKTRPAYKPLNKPLEKKDLAQLVYLQVGAFRDKTRAIKLKNQLSQVLTTPIKITLLNHSALYRVQVGPIHDSWTVKKLSKQLAELGIPSNRLLDV